MRKSKIYRNLYYLDTYMLDACKDFSSFFFEHTEITTTKSKNNKFKMHKERINNQVYRLHKWKLRQKKNLYD
jgi:hypothetical protein